jgi:hypothetical protein
MADYGSGQYGRRGYEHGDYRQGYDPPYDQQGYRQDSYPQGQYEPYRGGYQQPGPPPRKSSKVKYVIAGVAVLILLGTCSAVLGSGSSNTPNVVSAQSSTPAVPTSPANAAQTPSTSVPPAAPAVEPSPAGADLEVTVPNVVGMDLQSAQELLFPPLRSTSIDDTGQNRMQLVDSNWVVVRQDPVAGAVVLALTDVTLYVVKIGE